MEDPIRFLYGAIVAIIILIIVLVVLSKMPGFFT